MTIQWAVYEKTTFKDRVKYQCLRGRYFDNSYVNVGGLSESITEIPHTDEREKMFLDLDQSFAVLISNAYKALGDLTPEKLLRLLDSKTKLLSN